MLAELLGQVLHPPREPLVFAGAAEWWRDHVEATRSIDLPIDRAIAGAVRVDRLGYAFGGGYAAALRALVPGLPREVSASFAATEGMSAHPRAIATTLARVPGSAWRLDGRKDWVTLASDEGAIFVVARFAESDTAGRPKLRVVRVSAGAPGVFLEKLPEAPFVPEIPHGALRLENVRLEDRDILPRDGYSDYLKPFRTIEDLHVHAALLAWLIAVGARAGWPQSLRERMTAALIAARALALEDPRRSEIHIALGGVLAQTAAAVAESEPHWTRVDAPTRERWERDRPLLSVAGKARAARLEKAWGA